MIDLVPIGTILIFAGNEAPVNYAICDGKELNRVAYKELFNVIGCTYGKGDGFTSFNLPNLQSRVPVGQSKQFKLGDSGGAADGEVTLKEANIPYHNHKGTVKIPGHSHSRGTMNITGSFGIHSASSASGAFYKVTNSHEEIKTGNTTKDGIGFDASRTWTGETSRTSDATYDLNIEYAGVKHEQTEDSVEPISLMQPYQVINYIIRIQ